MSAKSATVQQPIEVKDNKESAVTEAVQKDVSVPNLSNDNLDDHGIPDWGVFSLSKFHPILGGIQKGLTVFGLLAGMFYAFMSIGAEVVSVSTVIFTYLAYGLIGTVGGYFALWLGATALVISPIVVLGSLLF